MKIRKGDPVYYKNEILKLLHEAIEEGLTIDVEMFEDKATLSFKADNGDTTEITFTNN